MSTPVRYISSNYKLMLCILSTYYNLGRKSINTQRHLPNYLELNRIINEMKTNRMGVG